MATIDTTDRTGDPGVGPSSRSRMRVAIVADIRLFRDGLAELIGRTGDIEVGAHVRSADAWTIPAAIQSGPRPDVVLWDVAGQDGLDALAAFASEAPDLRLLVLAVDALEVDVVRLAEAGMAGCVTRDADVAELIAAIRSVAAGEFSCSPRVAGELLRRVSALARRDREWAATNLTPRELEVVRLIGRGLTNKEIAEELTVALPTVKNHVHNALEKLGVHRRSQAVARVGAGQPVRPAAIGSSPG